MESPERKKKWKRMGSNGHPPPPAVAVEAVATSGKDDAAAGLKIFTPCVKGFGSARALGAHVEAQNGVGGGTPSKTLIAKSKKSKLSVDPGTPGFQAIRSNNQLLINGKVTLVCFVCAKGFPSYKSLYGHMRSHPDRNWRGIHPPLMELAVVAPASHRAKNNRDLHRSTPRSADPTVGMEADPSPLSAVVDFFTVGWSAKGKRGQKASDKWKEGTRRKLKDTVINVFVDCSVPMEANDLMLLAQAIPEKEMSMSTDNIILRSIEDDQDADAGFECAISASHSEESKSLINDGSLDENTRQRRIIKAIHLKSTKTEWDSDDEYWLKDHVSDELDDGVGLDQLRVEVGLDVGSSPSSCSPSPVPGQTIPCVEDHTRMSALNRTKKMNLRRTKPGENYYKQIEREDDPLAHTSRNKRKKPHHLVHDESESPDVSASDRDEPERTSCSQLVETPGPYRCRLCPKTFLRGQAPGGHQRVHWNGAVSSPGESSASQSQSSVSRRRGLELDLNEPAIADEEALGLLSLHVYDDTIAG